MEEWHEWSDSSTNVTSDLLLTVIVVDRHTTHGEPNAVVLIPCSFISITSPVFCHNVMLNHCSVAHGEPLKYWGIRLQELHWNKYNNENQKATQTHFSRKEAANKCCLWILGRRTRGASCRQAGVDWFVLGSSYGHTEEMSADICHFVHIKILWENRIVNGYLVISPGGGKKRKEVLCLLDFSVCLASSDFYVLSEGMDLYLLPPLLLLGLAPW